jgi:hypothetical protein
MKQTFTQSLLISFLFLFFGCSPKQTFYLNEGTGSFGTYHKVQREQASIKKVAVSNSEKDKSAITSASGILFSAASPQPEFQLPLSSTQARIGMADYESVITSKMHNQHKVKQKQKIRRKPEKLKKKFLAATDDGKPNHKLASLGFLLSFGGLLLILANLFIASTAIPLLLGLLLCIIGIFPSIKSLSKIKQEPDKYGGKGLAITGLVISGLMILLLIAFILFIMAWGGAFT